MPYFLWNDQVDIQYLTSYLTFWRLARYIGSELWGWYVAYEIESRHRWWVTFYAGADLDAIIS